MGNNININQRIGQIQPNKTTPNKKINQSSGRKTANSSFKELLSEKIAGKDEVKFSKHAKSRLVSRRINLSEQDLNQLTSGVKKAEEKGAQDSLIMVNNVAYVVSVENKTVVTAVDDGNMSEKVFTNIDSAVFMD